MANESYLGDQGTRGGQLPRDSDHALVEVGLPKHPAEVVNCNTFLRLQFL